MYPPKTNGWRAPKWGTLEKVTPFKYAHFWYLSWISGGVSPINNGDFPLFKDSGQFQPTDVI